MWLRFAVGALRVRPGIAHTRRGPHQPRRPTRRLRGFSVNTMKLHHILAMTAIFATAAPVSSSAQSGDPLAPFAGKRRLGADDKAKIRVEVTDRARSLKDANDNSERTAARAALTGSMEIKSATQAFQEYYARQCASQLSPLLTAREITSALDAIIVLRQLNHPETCDALITGLGSNHGCVRYTAAKAAHELLTKVKSTRECPGLIGALGKAGAAEFDAKVLREIYSAIGIHAGSRNANEANECAGALADVFEGRAQSLAQRPRDEAVEIPGFEAAAVCYKSASPPQRSRLVRSVRRLLELPLNRLFDDGTSAGRKKVLRDVVIKADDALRKMLKESGVDAPSRPNLNAKTTADTMRDYLKALDAAINRT